ncbi:hypothetical protein [Arthrobacter woluwensis]|uniref:hypothetical protein n=1 Tax=Arthrobacter woluwensis TaxID=156980 RepID=UPI001AAE3A07|nr:hypothetical protein [Arthrobacter woluwensis]QTF71255.1 hypothetical protein G8758_03965 [Arthrobacter woluwensis]
MTDQHNPDLIQVMEDFANFVAAVAGMKKQLMDAGFSPEVSEQIVLESLRTQPTNGGPTQ